MDFEWDEAKNAANLAKHGVAFEDAIEVFDDPAELTEISPDRNEPRHQTMGRVGPVVLFVAYTFRHYPDGRGAMRLISARPASRKERTRYERG